ncbi:hypothetical protein CASFOL_024579 [Castilleja foliolosa]|uniref:WRKY domain-containing protein n=1 Tax=Castilleja foliolosa TaxID=1961234 RepID=A0ABD3CNR1_9LAMI
MDNYEGDLADIVNAGASSGTVPAVPISDWATNDPIKFYPEEFGDPFTYMGDPLLRNMDHPVPGFSYSNIDTRETKRQRPSNIFSSMLPAVSPSDGLTPAVGSPRVLKSPSSSKGCLVESTSMQISSPRITGIKRRKSQARKVVCIPAPAPANSRATGEVVPSDLWAWRKYGQKPIKGSPFPRGYYRCSSSKGCSARKQVERSRTDPNMLVITYTCEHNHPWPTQRNALAGSTRSQPSKTNTCSASKTPPNPDEQEQKTENTVHDEHSPNVKLEENKDKNFELEFDEGFPPLAYNSNLSEDSFFADLGEIEPDPLDIMFTRVNKDLDPFVFYDWATNDSNNITGNG